MAGSQREQKRAWRARLAALKVEPMRYHAPGWSIEYQTAGRSFTYQVWGPGPVIGYAGPGPQENPYPLHDPQRIREGWAAGYSINACDDEGMIERGIDAGYRQGATLDEVLRLFPGEVETAFREVIG